MGDIFISYRRDDSQGFAGRLADDLSEAFGPEHVFRDIEIPIGSDFTDVLQRAIAASDALLVVIGRHWAAVSDQGYGSRLYEPTDWVRAEIEAALVQGKQVIPILVGGANMPTPDMLPKSIAHLPRLQAAILTDRHWNVEVEELVKRLRVTLPSLKPNRPQSKTQSESPAQVLRELGNRVLDQVASGQKPSNPSTFSYRLLQKIGRGIRKLLTFVIVLGLIYVGIRLFGDESMLQDLDVLEERLQMGWGRLQQYISNL